MTDGAREYLEGLWERIQTIQDDEIRTVCNELYRACSELANRVEQLEGSDRIVFVPEFLDS